MPFHREGEAHMTLRIHLLLLPLMTVFGTAGVADVSLERQFLWEEANAQMASAQTPADFLRAADTYGRLVQSDVRNGPLFYDLGTAYLKAGRYDDAASLLLRAERYTGSDPDVHRNLLLALAKGKRNPPAALPWYRIPLFWHYGIPGTGRMTIAVGAFFTCWIALTLGALGARQTARRLLILALAVLALFGSSILTTWHQESSERLLKQGRTPTPASPPGEVGLKH